MWRCGKATELANNASTLNEVLLAGEWTSNIPTRYSDEDMIDASTMDHGKVLQTVLEQSNDER